MPVEYGNLPFGQAIKFFLAKINMPSARWADVYGAMHDEMFAVAGAMQADLLADLRTAAERALIDGTTIEDFRKSFDAAVEKYGWSYKGGRAWRTRIIYETNLRQSYNAGRESQINDPDVMRLRPYSVYRHGDSRVPRPDHLAWDSTVLESAHPWWATHTPQNGWGCH